MQKAPQNVTTMDRRKINDCNPEAGSAKMTEDTTSVATSCFWRILHGVKRYSSNLWWHPTEGDIRKILAIFQLSWKCLRIKSWLHNIWRTILCIYIWKIIKSFFQFCETFLKFVTNLLPPNPWNISKNVFCLSIFYSSIRFQCVLNH